MNRLHTPFRRVSVVAAGALLGLTGVAILAAPASAHHPEPAGSYCLRDDNQVEVTWTVGNSERDLEGTMTKLESTIPADFTGTLALDAALPKKGDGPLTATQTHTFAGTLPELKLTVEAKWQRGDRNITEERSVTAVPAGDCKGEQNPSPTPTTPQPTETPEPTPTPEQPSPTPTEPPSATPTPTTPAEPEEPVFRLEETCDEMIFTVENPAKGIPFTATLVTEKGVTRTLESKPGETTSVSFDAYPGLEVTVSYDVVEGSETIEYTEPQDCGGEGGGLPVTGANTTLVAGGAAILLAAGAGLFVLARRRKLRFTA